MSDTVRTFTAIDVPAHMHAAIQPLTDQLQQLGYRIMSSKNMHITLQFHGDTTETEIATLQEYIDDLQGSAFTVQVNGCGANPQRSFPRVVWVGAESDMLEQLAAQFPRERSFLPHITVARHKNPPVSAAKSVLGSFHNTVWGTFIADSIVLYKSTLRPEGAHHVPLHTRTL